MIFKVRSDDANAFDHESYCNIPSLFAWRTVESSGGHFMDVLFYVKGALTCGKRLMVLELYGKCLARRSSSDGWWWPHAAGTSGFSGISERTTPGDGSVA